MSTPDTRPEADDDAKAREQTRLVALKIVVIVLGAILVALALVVFSTLIWRAVKGGGKPAAPVAASATALGSVAALLPAGGRVVSTALGDGKLAVTVEQPEGLVTILFDATSLRETGRIVWTRTP